MSRRAPAPVLAVTALWSAEPRARRDTADEPAAQQGTGDSSLALGMLKPAERQGNDAYQLSLPSRQARAPPTAVRHRLAKALGLP